MQNLRICKSSISRGEIFERRNLSVSLLDENTRSHATEDACMGRISRATRNMIGKTCALCCADRRHESMSKRMSTSSIPSRTSQRTTRSAPDSQPIEVPVQRVALTETPRACCSTPDRRGSLMSCSSTSALTAWHIYISRSRQSH